MISILLCLWQQTSPPPPPTSQRLSIDRIIERRSTWGELSTSGHKSHHKERPELTLRTYPMRPHSAANAPEVNPHKKQLPRRCHPKCAQLTTDTLFAHIPQNAIQSTIGGRIRAWRSHKRGSCALAPVVCHNPKPSVRQRTDRGLTGADPHTTVQPCLIESNRAGCCFRLQGEQRRPSKPRRRRQNYSREKMPRPRGNRRVRTNARDVGAPRRKSSRSLPTTVWSTHTSAASHTPARMATNGARRVDTGSLLLRCVRGSPFAIRGH